MYQQWLTAVVFFAVKSQCPFSEENDDDKDILHLHPSWDIIIYIINYSIYC